MNIINSYRFAAGGIPTNGLVAEYLFDTDASDTSGNAYNGTLNGNAAVSGGLLTLDGTGDFVSIADADDFSFTDGAGTDEAFSISLWVKSTISPAAQQLVSKFNNNVAVEWYLQFLGGGNAGKVALTIGDGGTDNTPIIYAIGSTVYTQNQWHHIVATYDGSESETGITIYLDNADDSATTGETPTYTGTANTSQRVLLGARDQGGTAGAYFAGDMDNVRIYNRELSASEVTQLFNEGHD
jgi:hypothetical protein